MAAKPTFSPTHLVPDDGLATFAGASPEQPGPQLDAGLEVTVAEWQGDWARIHCSNGWTAWVNGRLLVPVANPTGGSAHDGASTVVDDQLASLLSDALAQYATLVSELQEGRIDEEVFRNRAFRAGLVMRDEEAWILDLSSERWWRYDGLALTTPDIESPIQARG